MIGITDREDLRRLRAEYRRLHRKVRAQQSLHRLNTNQKKSTPCITSEDGEHHNYDKETWPEQLTNYARDLYSSTEVKGRNEEHWHLCCMGVRQLVDSGARQPRITVHDVMAARCKMKRGKVAGGCSGLTAEIIASLPPLVLQGIAELFQARLQDQSQETNLEPRSWRTLIITLLPKEPLATKLSKMRGISLMDCMAKLYMAILINKMRTFFKWTRPPSFTSHLIYGYEEGCSPEMLGRILSTLMVSSSEWRIPLTILSLDIKKAFDNAAPWAAAESLRFLGTPPILIKGFLAEMRELKAIISINGIQGNPVEYERSVRQGCTGSPFVWNCILRHVFAQAESTIQTSGHQDLGIWLAGHGRVWWLAWADNILILSETLQGGQILMTALSDAFGKLNLHWKKTGSTCWSTERAEESWEYWPLGEAYEETSQAFREHILNLGHPIVHHHVQALDDHRLHAGGGAGVLLASC